jgi:GWxTD domain-containing protein
MTTRRAGPSSPRSSATVDRGSLRLRTGVRVALAVALVTGCASDGHGPLRALPEEDRRWLTELVEPIILPDEKRLFLELTEPYQREQFREEFWQRRELPGLPPPLGPGYRHRYEELRELADREYDGWREDAGRMVLRWGEPAAIEHLTQCNSLSGSSTFRDLEIWIFQNGGPDGRSAVRLFLYRRIPMAPRKLWRIGVPDSEVLSPTACRKSFDALAQDCPGQMVPGDPCLGKECAQACRVWEIYNEIRARQGSAAGGTVEFARMVEPARLATEGLAQWRSKWAALSDPKARTIGVPPPAPAPTPEPRHTLTTGEMIDWIVALDRRYRDFLDLAAPLLTMEELSTFLQVPSGEKDQFMRRFWKRHA